LFVAEDAIRLTKEGKATYFLGDYQVGVTMPLDTHICSSVQRASNKPGLREEA
jgi:hypothetical protein